MVKDTGINKTSRVTSQQSVDTEDLPTKQKEHENQQNSTLEGTELRGKKLKIFR